MRPPSPRRPARALAFALVLGAGYAGTPAPKKAAAPPTAVTAALDETPDPPNPARARPPGCVPGSPDARSLRVA